MCTTQNYDRLIRSIFSKSVNSVQPKYLFQNTKCLQVLTSDEGHEILKFSSKSIGAAFEQKNTNLQIDITNKKCHLVGFGKAVYGMAVEVEKILEQRLVSGVLSVPIGTQEKFKDDIEMKLLPGSNIEIFEGAKNNLPDKASEDCARHIKRKMKNLTKDDIMIVLISGGGSALLPLPKSPITLDEKFNLIKKLAGKGATIEELNIVRIAISALKGGKLAELGEKANHIVSLIISDIINDPLELIASGPTVAFVNKTNWTPQSILEKYNLEIPKSIQKVIDESTKATASMKLKNTSTFIIGSNSIAINAAVEEANQNGLAAIPISNKIHGNVITLSEAYFKLAFTIKMFMLYKIDEKEFREKCIQLRTILQFDDNFMNNLAIAVHDNSKDICLISGGEPTVEITGLGVGGRNQELALRFGVLASNVDILRNVLFLSSGTDGLDGPSNAAGAIGNPKLIYECEKKDDIQKCLNNNDSYNFFANFHSGSQHIITGHTGTNVMDIQVLIIPKNKEKSML